MTLDQTSGETTTSAQTALTTQVSNQSTNYLASSGTYVASLKCTTLTTTISKLKNTLSMSSLATLHEAGSMPAGGSMSLNCVVYDASGLSAISQYQKQTQNATQTAVAKGNQPLLGSALLGPVGTGSVGTYVSMSTGTNRLVSIDGYGYVDHEEGTYSAGSFSLSCLAWSEYAGSGQSYSSSSQQTATTNVTGRRP